jgi:hypothetical protein
VDESLNVQGADGVYAIGESPMYRTPVSKHRLL